MRAELISRKNPKASRISTVWKRRMAAHVRMIVRATAVAVAAMADGAVMAVVVVEAVADAAAEEAPAAMAAVDTTGVAVAAMAVDTEEEEGSRLNPAASGLAP